MFVFSDGYVSLLWGFLGGSVVKNPPANAENTDDMGLIPGLDSHVVPGQSGLYARGEREPVIVLESW